MAKQSSIEVIGLEDVLSRIRTLPTTAQAEILRDVGKHSEEVLRTKQPPKRYVSRRQAYGKPFFTLKQQRYFFWALRQGIIKVPYQRTGKLGRGWKVRYTPGQSFATITNTVGYAPYVQGFMQSRHENLVGWKRVIDFLRGELSFKSAKFRGVTMTAVRKAIGKLRLG